MKGFVPPHIFTSSVQSLIEVDQLSKELVKRITTKKCLWLVRIPAADIEKMHEAELLTRFSPLAQNLVSFLLLSLPLCCPYNHHCRISLSWLLCMDPCQPSSPAIAAARRRAGDCP